MDKAAIFYVVIEAIIFMIPLITLFIKIGRYSERVDKLEKRLDNYDSIDNRLTAIETKIDLLLDGKIRTEE